jgi:hydrogenase maturation protease
MNASTLVIGFGTTHGDDAVGWDVVSRLHGPDTRLASDPLTLVDIPPSCELLILVDACRGTGPPGTIHRFVWPELPALTDTVTSTHGWSLAAGLQLAESLRRLPLRVVIFTVEAGPVEPGDELSPAMVDAAPRVVELILKEISQSQ